MFKKTKHIVSRLLHKLNILWQYFKKPKYAIQRGYIHRSKVPHFNDIENKEEWQKEVYQKVRDLAIANKLTSICDIGCGSAYKLLKYCSDFDITGVEVEPTLSVLKEKYPEHKWFKLEDLKNHEFDLVILSDVIEHIEYPDLFLKSIFDQIRFENLVISTPDRGLMNKNFKYGPPHNKHHYREWTFSEFGLFMKQFIDIENHYISNKAQFTQVIVGKNKITK